VPHSESNFRLNFAQVMAVQFAFFSAYSCSPWPWSKIVNSWIPEDHGAGLLTYGCRSAIVRAGGICRFVSLFLTRCSFSQRELPAFRCRQSLRGIARKTRDGLEPPGSEQAFNSLGTTDRPENRRSADPERRSISYRAIKAARATSAACVPRARSSSVKMPYT